MHLIPEQYDGATINKGIKKWLETLIPSMLTLSGAVGTGKTRQLYAIIQAFADALPYRIDKKCWYQLLPNASSGFVFFIASQLFFEFNALSFNRSDPTASRKFIDEITAYRGVLMIDDMGDQGTNPYALNLLYMVVSEREKWGRPTIITTNLGMKKLQEIWGARIADRLAGGLVIKFTGKSRRRK